MKLYSYSAAFIATTLSLYTFHNTAHADDLKSARVQASDLLKRNFILDESILDLEKLYLNEDLKQIQAIQLKSKSSKLTDGKVSTPFYQTAYEKLFPSSSDDSSGIMNYLKTRVKFLVSASNIELGAQPASGLVAVNLSLGIWLGQLLKTKTPEKAIEVLYQKQKIRIQDTRVGFVNLNYGYAEDENSNSRIATLIHEARHSDCPIGFKSSQLDQLRVKVDSKTEFDIRENIGICAFAHSNCPDTHSLAGIPACDTFAFGSYGVESVYQTNLIKRMISMTEEAKQLSMTSLFESNSRLIGLDGMITGAKGLPNMEHKGYIP